jgi:PAS domain S-box-containing protein
MENQKKLILTFKKISKIISIISIAIGAVVLVGWAFDVAILKSILPNFVTMKVNTALAFVFSGLALFFVQAEENSKKWKKYVSRVSAVLVIFIGLATLAEMVFGWNLGIDQLFFKEAIGAVFTQNLGRMAPFSAVNFSFIGLALILLSFNREYKFTQYLCSFVLLLSLTGVIGYLYGVKEFIGIIPWLTPMALNTAIAFFLLAIGIIFARPASEPVALMAGDNAGGVITRQLIPIKIIGISLLGLFQLFWYSHSVGVIAPDSILYFKFHMAFLVVTCIVFSVIVVWRVAVFLRKIDYDRKIVAEKLESEKNKLNTLLQSIGDGVIAIDRNWKIILWNESASRLSGWKSTEVIGKPFRDFIKLIRERDRSENIGFIEDVMVMGKIHFMENHTCLIQKDGRELPVGDSASPIFNVLGEVEGAIIVLRDATKERESAGLRSDFAYASHQLRTPITRALYSLEVSLSENNLKTIKNNIEVAYQSLESIRKLSEELVAISEIDQGLTISKIKPVKLSKLFSEIIKEADERIKDSGVKIKILSISPLLKIDTDEKLLKKALTVILDNAIVYSPKRGEIKISAEVKKNSVLIEIQNSGMGITPEHQALVFTKFFRGNNFNTTEIAGAGLGLFIAKECVKLLNGKIWFKSEAGEETIFYLSLPLDK